MPSCHVLAACLRLAGCLLHIMNILAQLNAFVPPVVYVVLSTKILGSWASVTYVKHARDQSNQKSGQSFSGVAVCLMAVLDVFAPGKDTPCSQMTTTIAVKLILHAAARDSAMRQFTKKDCGVMLGRCSSVAWLKVKPGMSRRQGNSIICPWPFG